MWRTVSINLAEGVAENRITVNAVAPSLCRSEGGVFTRSSGISRHSESKVPLGRGRNVSRETSCRRSVQNSGILARARAIAAQILREVADLVDRLVE